MYVLLLVLLSPNGTLSPMSAEFEDRGACIKAVEKMSRSFASVSPDKKVIYSYDCVEKKGGYR